MKSNIIKTALTLAQSSKCSPFKCAAVIFSGKRILSSGINDIRSTKRVHPKHKRFSTAMHAEIAAFMHMFPENVSGASIFVCRINNSGKISNAKPCGRCQSALSAAGIKYVYCTNDDGGIDKYKIKTILENVKFDEKDGHDYRNLFISPKFWE